MDIKEEIKKLHSRMESGEIISDAEMLDFMNQSREYLMKNSVVFLNPPAQNNPNESGKKGSWKPFTTCSCGSLNDEASCEEDGYGNYSKFFFNNDGECGRLIIGKENG